MYGHLTISDLFGRVYWRTEDVADAYEEVKSLGRAIDLLVVRNENNGRTVYFKSGVLRVYVKDGQEDWSKER